MVGHTGGLGRRGEQQPGVPDGTPSDAPGTVEGGVPAEARPDPVPADPTVDPAAPTPPGSSSRGWRGGRTRRSAGRPQGAVRTGAQVVAAVGTGGKASADLDRPDGDDAAETGGGPEPDEGGLDLPDHDVGAVLRITPFRRLWMALALSSFGDWLGLLATAAMAKNLAGGSYTRENFAIAGVFILRLAPAVLLGPLAGALADRIDRRWTLVFGDLFRFVLFASIPLVGTLGWLYSATLLIECFALFWMPAKDATVPNLVPRRRLEAANQISLVATYGTAPVAAVVYSGLALFAELVGHFVRTPQLDPVSIALWFNALTFLVSGLTIWNLEIPPSRRPSGERQAGVLRLILDGWAFVGGTPVVRGLVLGMLGAFAAAGFVIGLAQTFVQDLGAGQAGFGVLFAAVFVGLAGGMWIGPRLLGDFSRRRLFGLALATAGVSLMLLALVPDIVLATLCTVVVGACGGVAWVTGYTLLGLEVDDEVRGRTFAFLQSAARVVLVLVLALGPALAAPIGTHAVHVWGWRLSYNGAAFVFLLSGVIALAMGVTSFRQMDDRVGTPLRADLRRAWTALWERPVAPVGRQYAGVFLAFEGGDGAGKSTQVRMLADWLEHDQGHEVVVTREPGATRLGVQLRELLLGDGEPVDARTEALLFAADRSHHVDAVIRPALERGAVVVTDRYVDSSVAYQGAGRDLDAEEVARLSRWATAGLVPDLTVLLDLAPEISRVRRARDTGRSGEDRMEAQPEDFHDRVRRRFLDLARREPHRYLVLDASDPREQLAEVIRRRVRDLAPISPARRADLESRLGEEELARQRRADAEAEVRRLDAELRGRSRDEQRARQEARRRAREEVERQLLDEEAEQHRREEERRLAEESARAVRAVREEEAARRSGQVPPTTALPSAPAPKRTPPPTSAPPTRTPPTAGPRTPAPPTAGPARTTPPSAGSPRKPAPHPPVAPPPTHVLPEVPPTHALPEVPPTDVLPVDPSTAGPSRPRPDRPLPGTRPARPAMPPVFPAESPGAGETEVIRLPDGERRDAPARPVRPAAPAPSGTEARGRPVRRPEPPRPNLGDELFGPGEQER